MPDPQNNEIETSPTPTPEAAPTNPPNPLYQGGATPTPMETPAITPAEALPVEAPAATPSEQIPPTPFDKGGVNTPAPAPQAPVNPPVTEQPVPREIAPAPTSPAPESLPAQPSAPLTGSQRAKELWTRFMDKVSMRKKARLEKIMAMALKKKKIANGDVQKLLHVSDATATRYLKELVRQGRLKQSGARAGTVYEPSR